MLDIKATQEQLGDDYMVADISCEEWRDIHFVKTDTKIRIHFPQVLIIRKGGSTHRVVDAQDRVWLYACPSEGLTMLRWKNKDGEPAVKF